MFDYNDLEGWTGVLTRMSKNGFEKARLVRMSVKSTLIVILVLLYSRMLLIRMLIERDGLKLSIDTQKSRFESISHALILEC
jgi:hypothetical protein